MENLDNRTLKDRAGESLRRAGSGPKKIVFIYSLTVVLALLAVTGLDYLLDMGIAQTGGLSGMGQRNMLTTLSAVLEVAVNLALPFWTLGYTAAALGFARERTAGPEVLLSGFRAFGPSLRLLLLRGALYFLPMMACMYPAMALFCLTPMAKPLLDAMTPAMTGAQDVASLMESEAFLAAVEEVMVPMTAFFIALALLACLPVFYRVRFAGLALMGAPENGALAALQKSFRLTKRRFGYLFRLDVSFWWYYVLDVVITVLAYGDVVLMLMGVKLDSQIWFFGFYLAHLAGQLLLNLAARNPVETTYALCYDTLEEAPAPVRPAVKKLPWE